MMENYETQVNDFYDIDKENIFCSKSEQESKNKKEIKVQIINLTYGSSKFNFKTNSYYLYHGKINLNWTKPIKDDLINKYWIIEPNQKYEFYGKKDIKTMWKNKEVSELQNLVGILMIYKKFLTSDEIKRFDNYFNIIMKCKERKYYKNSDYGKILFIGGDLKDKLGIMLKKEFGENDIKENNYPIYISIMVYDEYEKIELEGFDYCDTISDHDGFWRFQKVFSLNFASSLSNKVNRIRNEKESKKNKLNEENKKKHY